MDASQRAGIGRRFGGLRLHRRGAQPPRVLLIGDRLLVGERDGGLAVRIADQVARRTGRGLDLDVVWDLAPALRAVSAATKAWRLWRYEAVIVLVREAQLQERRLWRGGIARVAERVIPELAEASGVLVVRVGAGAGDVLRPEEQPAAVSTLVLSPDDDGSVAQQSRSAETIALRISRVLEASADVTRAGGSTAAERRSRPEPEHARQLAVDRTAEALGGLTPHLERVVLLARNTFEVPFAQVNLLDRGRIRTLAFVGAPGDSAEQPLCTIAVRGSGPTIIADTWEDHRLDENPHVHDPQHPVRFYAAHPIESIDGYRIGTLCVFDFKPHDAEEIDPSVLRDLALLAEAEISTLPEDR